MELNESEVKALLGACSKDGSLICTEGGRNVKDLVDQVFHKKVTSKDSKCMEEFLNSACSDENLVELIAVLKGDESLDPALREVARLISRHYESKIDFHESLAFARARDAERNSGRPHEKLIKKCKEDLEAIETASRATLILFVERLITEQLQSDYTLTISGSLSGKMPSEEMIEGMQHTWLCPGPLLWRS